MGFKTATEPTIGITLGDPAGVGPEILAKLLEETALGCTPLVIGDARIFVRAQAIVGAKRELVVTDRQALADGLDPRRAHLLDLRNVATGDVALGEVSAAAGRAAGQYIEAAIELALSGAIDAVVTNPIHKEAFLLGGWGKTYPGHTEMFADLCGAKRTCMMLACGSLRVCHVSTHVGLRQALAHEIKRPRIFEVIRLAHDACTRLGIESPRIGVAGVNPHAGVDAIFGDEEQREIEPAVADARAAGMTVDGPIAADTLFCKAKGGMYHVVVAMYHDQGHIPVKLAGFIYDHQTQRWTMQGVNVTLGLPIVRTSVDHGTAFDKAGKGTADHHSLKEALLYAIRLGKATRT